MIKQYSIGRSDDSQIKIQDNSQKVSRNHATLKVLDNGKIFITDHSSNGTFVNGVKISQSVDYPVKRGDSISFAHVAELNWDLIPRTANKLIYYLAGSIKKDPCFHGSFLTHFVKYHTLKVTINETRLP